MDLIKSNQILFAQNTSHLNAASGRQKAVGEQGQQGSKSTHSDPEHITWNRPKTKLDSEIE